MSSQSSATDPVSPSKKKKRPKYPTWEHPAGSGIKIAEMPNKTGGRVYGVSYQVRIPAELLGVPNKREMHQRPTKAEAERFAEDRFLALKAHGTEFAKIPAQAQRALAMAWGVLQEHTTKSGTELNVVDVVKAGIGVLDPVGGRKKLSDVFAELRASKAERFRAGTLDASTERDFRRRSEALETEIGEKLVSALTTEDIETALKKIGAKLSRRSTLNYRNTLAEALRHAKAKRYCAENPMTHFTREAYKTLGGVKAERNLDAINILTVAEARRLLLAAQEHGDRGMLATVVLRLFCGLRTKEVSRLDWSEVHWLDSKPFVHIPQGKAKKRRIRHVDIPENALAWLKLCDAPASGKIDPFSAKTYCKRFGRIAQAAGIGALDDEGRWESEWENNDTRHSFGSYHYALHGDAILTARLMGHKQGDEVLFAHYRTLVRKEDAERFFAIVPEVGAEKVTVFPQAAAV